MKRKVAALSLSSTAKVMTSNPFSNAWDASKIAIHEDILWYNTLDLTFNPVDTITSRSIKRAVLIAIYLEIYR